MTVNLKWNKIFLIIFATFFSVASFANVFAQSANTNQTYDFFGTMSVRVYCTIAVFIPGSDNQNCKTDLILNGPSGASFANNLQIQTTGINTTNYATTTLVTEKIIYEKPIKNDTNVIYLLGPKGDKGDPGQSVSTGFGFGGNFVIPQLTSGGQYGGAAGAQGPAGVNGVSGATGTSISSITSTLPGLLTFRFSDGATTTISVLNSTSTSLFTNILSSLNGEIDNFIAQNATVTNSTSTNTFSQNIVANSTNFVNSKIDNLSVTTATFTSATATTLFADISSSTNLNFVKGFGVSATITNLVANSLFLTGTDATINLSTKDWVSLNDSNLLPNYFATGNFNKNFFSSGNGNENHFGNGNNAINYFGEGLNVINYFGYDNSSHNVFTGTTEFLGTVGLGGNGSANVIIGNIANITNFGSGIINLAAGNFAQINIGNASLGGNLNINLPTNISTSTILNLNTNNLLSASSTFASTTMNNFIAQNGYISNITVGCIQTATGTPIGGNCVSDQNLKTNIEEIATSSLLAKIGNLKFVTYSWNDLAKKLYNKPENTKVTGVIAQDVEAQFPELVSTDSKGYKQVNLSTLQWYLFAAIKELNNKVDYTNNSLITFADIIVNKLTAKEVKTDKLCIKDTCIEEQDLKDFLKYKQSQINMNSSPSNTPINKQTQLNIDTKATDTSSTTATSTRVIVDPVASSSVGE